LADYTFVGWYDADENEAEFPYAVEGNITLFANWTYTPVVPPPTYYV